MTVIATAVEKTLAASVQAPEQIMAQNAAWLLGLEPLPMIQFDDWPTKQSMPAEIPDAVEICEGPPATQRPSNRGLLAQMLEQEPMMMSQEPPVDVAIVQTAPVFEEPNPPEVMTVPAWAQVGSSPEPLTKSSDTLVKPCEPETSVIKPRRIVPRAPVSIPLGGDSKCWLNWWK
jgi:hypothetical protein